MTKAETEIIERIQRANKFGALCGLSISPADRDFNHRRFRFVKRLYEAEAIIWVSYTPKHGAGWATPEALAAFRD